MSDNVIPISTARSASSNVQCRACGGEWWILINEASWAPGKVILAAEPEHDRIVGYSGVFICGDCGRSRCRD